jgi:hypothetical protein
MLRCLHVWERSSVCCNVYVEVYELHVKSSVYCNVYVEVYALHVCEKSSVYCNVYAELYARVTGVD